MSVAGFGQVGDEKRLSSDQPGMKRERKPDKVEPLTAIAARNQESGVREAMDCGYLTSGS
jgi:hypothetical protein